jgi:hypothetical protein
MQDMDAAEVRVRKFAEAAFIALSIFFFSVFVIPFI